MKLRFWQIRLRFRKKSTLPLILQEEMAECAHACIAMIVQYWGCKISLATLRTIQHTSTHGMTVLQMSQLFDRLGFKTRALRVAYSDLSHVKTPAILHWDQKHFVVLKSIRGQKIIVHDPALGVRSYTKVEASALYSGIVLEIEKTTHLPTHCPVPQLTIWTLLKSIIGLPRVLGTLLLLSIVLELMQIVNPMFMQYVTDYVVGTNALVQMCHIGLGCVIFVLLQGLTEYLRSHLILYVSVQIAESFAAEVFKHVLSLPLRYFTHRHLSDIQAKFQCIDQLKNKLSTDFMHTCLDGVMILVTLIVMVLYSPLLTAVIASMLSLYACVLYGNMRTYQHEASAALALHAKSAVTFHETLRGIAPVKSFLKEHLWFQLWRNDYVDALNHDVRIARIQIRYRVLNQILHQIEYVLVICIGAGLVTAQRLSIGMLLAFLAYRMILVNKSAALIQYVFTYQTLTLQLQRLQDLIDHEPEFIQSSSTPCPVLRGAMHVQAISFTYPGHSQPLFKDVSFSVHPGEKIAIVGPSGCGKTTLLKMMMGFEQPTSGTILLDDMPLALFGVQHFRQLSASVMQDDVLFTGSILDNITFFAEEVDMAFVYEVAKLVCIHESIVGLPMGYDSLIGQVQTTISGGQRQRLLLARALYKKPQFLFLDEATSHLDLPLERAINHALRSCQMTQIMVAHRPDTIAMADRVIELT